MAEIDYEIWSRWHDTGGAELEAMGGQVEAFERRPTISLLAAVGEVDELWLRDGVSSIERQVYPDWELCACQYGSRARLEDVLSFDAAEAPRLRPVPALGQSSQSPANALETALAAATGDYVAVIGEGDELAPDALFRVAEMLQHVDADILYTDEDSIDHRGDRSAPVFKPEWSPDLLLTTPYLGRLCLIRRTMLAQAGGMNPEFGPMIEWEAQLRATELTRDVAKVPGVLYHRRTLPSAVDHTGESASEEALARVAESALKRRGIRATARPTKGRQTVRIMHEAVPPGSVSVIVQASRGGNPPLLHRLSSELSAGRGELILAGPRARKPPGLEVTVVEHGEAAVAANLAAARATGEVLVFVDGRATLSQSASLTGWITELVTLARRSGVGAVSGRLINADETVRHGGTAVDLEDLGDHRRQPLGPGDSALLRLMDVLNPAAATEDLMAVRAQTFRAAGGFDESRLPSRFFGMDLAFRLEERGLRSVYTPYAALICSDDRAKPSSPEIAHMWQHWQLRLAALDSGRWPPHDRRHRTQPSVAHLPGNRDLAGVAG